MLVMMRAERGTKYIAAAEAAACRRICRACRGLVNGLGAADIDADVDDSKASPPHPPHVCLASEQGASEEGYNKDQDYQFWRTTFCLFFFGVADIAGCVLSEVHFRSVSCTYLVSPVCIFFRKNLLAHHQGAKREPRSIQTPLGRRLDS